MSEVSVERDYFVLSDGILTFLMAFTPFCNEYLYIPNIIVIIIINCCKNSDSNETRYHIALIIIKSFRNIPCKHE